MSSLEFIEPGLYAATGAIKGTTQFVGDMSDLAAKDDKLRINAENVPRKNVICNTDSNQINICTPSDAQNLENYKTFGDRTNFKLCLLSCISAKNMSDRSANFTGKNASAMGSYVGKKFGNGASSVGNNYRKTGDGNHNVREKFIRQTLIELLQSNNLAGYTVASAVGNNITSGIYNNTVGVANLFNRGQTARNVVADMSGQYNTQKLSPGQQYDEPMPIAQGQPNQQPEFIQPNVQQVAVERPGMIPDPNLPNQSNYFPEEALPNVQQAAPAPQKPLQTAVAPAPAKTFLQYMGFKGGKTRRNKRRKHKKTRR